MSALVIAVPTEAVWFASGLGALVTAPTALLHASIDPPRWKAAAIAGLICAACAIVAAMNWP